MEDAIGGEAARRRPPSRRDRASGTATAGAERRRRPRFSLRPAAAPTPATRPWRSCATRPPGLRLRRLGAADARLRLRHHAPTSSTSRFAVARPRPDRPRAAPISSSSPARRYFVRAARRSATADDARPAPAAPTRSRWSSRSRPASAATSRAGAAPEVGAWVDGAMPFRGETIAQYVQGVHAGLPGRPRHRGSERRRRPAPPTIETRYRYNPTSESIYSIVPSVSALLLLLIPAILMTVSSRAREGARLDHQLLRHAATRLEFLLGKQLPYVAIGMLNFVILIVLAVFVFGVPIKGSFLTLTLCTLLYVIDRRPAFGLVTSAVHPKPGRGRVRHRDPDHRRRPSSSPACSSPSRRWRAPGASSARSGRRPTTCTQPRRVHQGARLPGSGAATSWPSPSSSRCSWPSACSC